MAYFLVTCFIQVCCTDFYALSSSAKLILGTKLLLKFLVLGCQYMLLHSCRDCFVTCDEMQSVKQLKAAINRRFNENCGVYWNNLTDAQLTDYVWSKIREFMTNGGKTLVGTLTTGRQHFMKKRNEEGQLVPIKECDQAFLESCKDAVDDFDESTYIINEKLQVYMH